MQKLRHARFLAALTTALLLAGCGTLRAPTSDSNVVVAPSPAPSPPTAAVAAPPPAATPAAPPAPSGAVPRVERIAKGAPNAPYEVRGESYDPENSDVPIVQTGVASWYGKPFHGRRTASGEVYDMHAMTAAHKTMPLPSYARVRNPANGREVIVRINDRGPFKASRIIDLSFAAARRLGIAGVAKVEVVRLTHDAIRSGAWQQPAARANAPGRVVIAAAADE
jgi:rare lipoprotein A